MTKDMKAVDRWHDDGGAVYQSAIPANRRTPEVRIKIADNANITLKIRAGWRYRRVSLITEGRWDSTIPPGSRRVSWVDVDGDSGQL